MPFVVVPVATVTPSNVAVKAEFLAKPLPVIVTVVPTTPLVGLRVILAAAAASLTTGCCKEANASTEKSISRTINARSWDDVWPLGTTDEAKIRRLEALAILRVVFLIIALLERKIAISDMSCAFETRFTWLYPAKY